MKKKPVILDLQNLVNKCIKQGAVSGYTADGVTSVIPPVLFCIGLKTDVAGAVAVMRA